MTASEIERLIRAGLSCDFVHVEGDGRHWSAIVVSSAFEGLRSIARHQRVYAALGDRIAKDEVHALSLKTWTPAEWAARQGG
ncbi:acid stress-induced BolA-like protein IbaG/YrbA [Tibeticola sediminis]|uniref:Acid stress-induced BolA-like protein IbaG/YrbA n=1 Tax=Tibeticola sediminis TaxID=1917811 RepID=A0A3N4UCI3_9BURK|nr:BolA family protein [Tibeticola sediminis]RPE67528.1 acid stress-induced BolA-like protein IbaG/YrbA [Tibeticola sediminis]